MNRYLPYGYEIRNGEVVINGREAKTVKQVYRLHTEGHSFNRIAEQLNEREIPYSPDKAWNKNSVARMLQNENYLGSGRFPQLLDEELVSLSRERHKQTLARYDEPHREPSDVVWSKLRCGECNEQLRRVGGRLPEGVLILRCKDCRYEIKTTDDELFSRIRQRMNEDANRTVEYAPTAEVLKLENEVNRHLEKPSDTVEARRAILACASAKYDCYTAPRVPIMNNMKRKDRLSEIDWKQFGRAVFHISVKNDGSIEIRYTGG